VRKFETEKMNKMQDFLSWRVVKLWWHLKS